MSLHYPLMAAEFPDFDQNTLPIIPPSFEDSSWRNDVCPSFQHPVLGIHLWVEYDKKEDRESGLPRFRLDQLEQVTVTVDGKEETSWEWPIDFTDTLIVEGDDWDEILQAFHRLVQEGAEAGRFTIGQAYAEAKKDV